MTCERLEILKEGEKSKIYLVFDSDTHKMMVEKHLSGALTVYERLRDLHHPYLPAVYEVQQTEQETVVWEEYIQGESIAKIPSTEKQCAQWLLELCQVLAFLHKHGILHRDIKPSNLLIGSDGHIRLIDFDAAREEKQQADTDTRLLGTRGYAPPEQYGFAQTDARADIYAVGVTFCELLGATAKKRRWRSILKRCTALDPKRRYRHVCQIRRAIYLGRIRRRIIDPICMLAVLFCVLFSGFMLWSYTTDSDVKMALEAIMKPRRDHIFEAADIGEIKKSDASMGRFLGDENIVHQFLTERDTSHVFISSGYTDENGFLLFGGFSTNYNINTGELHYERFEGLFTMTSTQEVRHIPPELCSPYASAVLTLYNLNIFDTPII